MPIVNDMPIVWAGVVIRMNDGRVQGWQIPQPTEFTITRQVDDYDRYSFGDRRIHRPELLVIELKGYSATWHHGANIPDLREIEARKAIGS